MSVPGGSTAAAFPPYLPQVRARLAERPAADPHTVAADLRRDSAVLADDVVERRWSRATADELGASGRLEPLLALPGVTDVLVNAPDDVWVDRSGRLERTDVRFPDEAAVRRLAQRLAAGAGRRLDDAQPWVDAALPDGTRLHALLPPLAAHTTICLRVLARRRMGLAELVAAGALDAERAGWLRAAARRRLAVLVSGGTGAGKTTLLGALLDLAGPAERVLTVEDAAEIVTVHPHVVRLVCRPANVEGSGAVAAADLVRQGLRMRPDRIVVGEFRGGEVLDLLAALNTGHAGGMASVHANSLDDVPARLVALAARAGTDAAGLAAQAGAAFELVLHLQRAADGSRRLAAIGVPEVDDGRWRVVTAWSRLDGDGPAAGRLQRALGQFGAG